MNNAAGAPTGTAEGLCNIHASCRTSTAIQHPLLLLLLSLLKHTSSLELLVLRLGLRLWGELGARGHMQRQRRFGGSGAVSPILIWFALSHTAFHPFGCLSPVSKVKPSEDD